MFEPIKIPFDVVMLFNEVKLKEGISVEDVELAIGEMCHVVKETYGDDEGGFIAGQVFKLSGFISKEGSFSQEEEQKHEPRGDLALVTYWKTFDLHELSHADHIFKEKFEAVLEFCDSTSEIGYELLWQGIPENK